MGYAIALNGMILALVFFALVFTGNPMCILALFFLRDMPFGLMAHDHEEEEPGEYDGGDNGKNFGFNQGDGK